jgi:hypothetical protein
MYLTALAIVGRSVSSAYVPAFADTVDEGNIDVTALVINDNTTTPVIKRGFSLNGKDKRRSIMLGLFKHNYYNPTIK